MVHACNANLPRRKLQAEELLELEDRVLGSEQSVSV